MKALILDKDEDYIDIMSDILFNEKITCEGTNNIEDAIKLIKEKYYDILILDLYFPEDKFNTLINEAKRKGTYIILATIFSNIKDSRVDYILEKPFDLNDIRELLRNIKCKKKIKVKVV